MRRWRTSPSCSSITTPTGDKMEFLKRKHFSLWVITLVFAAYVDISNGLQGVPTWMCLGLKSPFIEFSNEIEVLANNSISLNITKDEQAIMHQEGLKKLGTYIKPVDLRDASTGFVKANLTKKLPPSLPGRKRGHMNPIQEEMEQKPIVLLDEDTDENGLPASLTEEDKKFIVPMALKNISPDPRLLPTTSTTTSTTTTTTTTTATPDFASNIDDLKNHILFLQNMTKHNINFQSKFVVFPSLQKEKSSTTTIAPITTTTTTTLRPLFRYTPPVPPPTRRVTIPSHTSSPSPHSQQFDHYFDHEDPMVAIQREKITIVPQVLLLNDQTPPDDNEEDSRRFGNHKDQRIVYARRRNFRKSSTPPSVPMGTSTSSTTTEKPLRRNPKRQRNNGEKRNKNQRKPCKNPDSPKCQRQRSRQEQRMLQQQSQQPHQPFFQMINNTKRFAVSIEIPDSFKIKQNQTKEVDTEQKLSRSARSHHKRRNIGINKFAGNYGSTYFDGPSKEFIMSGGQVGPNGQMFLNNTPNPTVEAYSEPIDINPDLCYDVDGLTYGQKRLCVMHTNVMPAISRGARSAIQECQHQFKNRRWNCSTTDDTTVFGPMSSLGSPEMAFIYALASATVTSFIARACRDGQLASCGCSRGARPRQLHDDWAWGGCGDDLEYAYKFSQDFIDIREKERKRGTRGLASGSRIKTDEKSLDPPKSPPSPSSYRDTNFTATDAVDASKLDTVSGVARPSPSEQQNSTTVTALRSIQDGHANITVDVNKNSSSSSNNSNASPTSLSSDYASNKDKSEEDEDSTEVGTRFKPEDLLELQERITKEILNSKLKEKEMLELQEKINREILNSKVFSMDHYASMAGRKKKNQRAVNSMGSSSSNLMGISGNGGSAGPGRLKNVMSAKARSLMNLHNNEAGRRAVIKKARITCKCHGVSGSCSLITCWQQLSSIREIGDYLRERYDEATEVKLNKRGRLQVKDPQFKVPTAHDLVYLDESPDWCRNNRQLQWPGTHGRICNKTSSGLDGCGILCCGRGYNTKNIVVRERCNCKFHWCCQVKCDICVKVLEEHTCK